MSQPLEARWAETRKRLDAAQLALAAQCQDEAFAQYRDELGHNELELALDALERVAETCGSTPGNLELLALAAESMEFHERAAGLRRMAKGALHVLPPPQIKETCLTVSNLERSIDFYTRIFAYEVVASSPEFCALSAAGQQVLLLFLQGATESPRELPGGTIPPHGASGVSHIGFAIPRDQLESWESVLPEHGVAIEGRVAWPRGGISLYFRDPDGHLLELLTPGVWTIY